MFDKNEYFDINITYAKENVSDIFIKIAVSKRGAAPAPVTVLPTVWFYNRWVDTPDEPRTAISLLNKTVVTANHSRLGNYYFYFQPADERLFTENETNFSKIDAGVAKTPFTKDAFYEAIVNGVNMAKLRSKKVGTKFSPVYELGL